ncbi:MULTISPECIES: hypothetical protein [unclassified Streptomyces]|uniref:hypothetical protein n=1 Tax=unclassified Streptomyces TaxID=2593676 RepID=UPI003321FE4C
MSETRIIGTVGVDLGDGVVQAVYGTDFADQEYALLRIGHVLSLHVANASPEALQELADAALELKAWRERQLGAGERAA